MCTCEKKTTIYENTSISKSTSLMGLQCTVGHHKKLPPPPILPRLPPRFYGFLPDKKIFSSHFHGRNIEQTTFTKQSMVIV